MSTHQVNVVEIKMEKHPNADALSIVKIPGTNYTALVATKDWHDGQLAAYVEPDYVVPANRLEFDFLKERSKPIENQGMIGYRIKVKKLRGIVSMGLLVPAPEGSKAGDNVLELLGITRYEPPLPMSTGGEVCKAPSGVYFKYDVESAYRYADLFQEGEEVIVTEKIHGASARFIYKDGEMFCGSRTEWKRQEEKNLWWRALQQNPWIEDFCRQNEGKCLYGEVFGQVQDLKYGAGKNDVFFRAFDILHDGIWLSYPETANLIPDYWHVWVPFIYKGLWDKEKIFAMADGESVVSKVKQIREGIVIRPFQERTCLEIGRVQLKIVSNAYLERA